MELVTGPNRKVPDLDHIGKSKSIMTCAWLVPETTVGGLDAIQSLPTNLFLEQTEIVSIRPDRMPSSLSFHFLWRSTGLFADQR